MKRALLLFLSLSPAALRADELAVYYLNNLSVQYEGTGYRQTTAGWELKVKPQAPGQGLRWRAGAAQIQLWRNNPFYSWEDGNSDGPVRRQTGQTRLAVQTGVIDGRMRLAGTPVEAVLGLLGVHASFDRKDVVFDGVLDGGARETLFALGPVAGFHGRTDKALGGGWSFRADGEVLAGHFFWTRNRQRTNGGSLRREGFSYLFRGELGAGRGPWRVNVGVVRQMHEILVPGGKGLPNGAAASLPINKLDFGSPFLSVTWDLP